MSMENDLAQQQYEAARQEFAQEFFGEGAAEAPPITTAPDTPAAGSPAAGSTSQAMAQADSSAAADPLADAPSYVRDMATRLETQGATIERLTAQIRSAGGRQGALAARLKELQGLFSRPAVLAPQDQADFDQLRVDYPEVADAMDRRTQALHQAMAERTARLVHEISEPAADEAREAALLQGYHALDTAEQFADVRDWQQIVRHGDFVPWLRSQPEAVQSLANSRDPVDAAYLFRNFKSAIGAVEANPARQLQQRRQQVLGNAAAPLGRGTGRQTHPDESDDAHWRAYYAKQLGLR